MDDKQQDQGMPSSGSSDFFGDDIWGREPAPAPAAAPTPEPPAATPAFQEEASAVQQAKSAPHQASGDQDARATGSEAGAPAPGADHAAVPEPAPHQASGEQDAGATGSEAGAPAPGADHAAIPEPAAPAAAAAQTTAVPAAVPTAPSSLALDEMQVLTVGRGIRLVAKVCECESLTVEGHLEATAYTRSLVVAEGGCFIGSAEVEEAEISGTVEGKLTASKRLTIRPTGRISGTTRYQEIVIEAGGQILGTSQCLLATPDGAAAPAAPADDALAG